MCIPPGSLPPPPRIPSHLYIYSIEGHTFHYPRCILVNFRFNPLVFDQLPPQTISTVTILFSILMPYSKHHFSSQKTELSENSPIFALLKFCVRMTLVVLVSGLHTALFNKNEEPPAPHTHTLVKS